MSDVVARVKAALEGVTEGPWITSKGREVARCDGGIYPGNIVSESTKQIVFTQTGNSTNSEFIAAARDLVPELVAEVERLREVLDELVDPDPCRFDHDGDCQAHGFFGITADTPCAHERAKRLLEVNR